jgi:hypothetical protein
MMEPICTDCKKFFGDLKDLITSATTEKELEKMIEDELCSQLGEYEDMVSFTKLYIVNLNPLSAIWSPYGTKIY